MPPPWRVPGQRLPPSALPHADPALLTAKPYLWRLGLGGILAVQVIISLKLVWSNGAFGDEALYLLDGRLEWAHWLHGAPLPALHASGAPQIYPPLGAAANAVGGLAAARLLSLLFMLAATALLYCVGTRLFGRGAALAGAGLWAVSEPVLRLAFATFDPLSCLLVIFSAWLAVRSAYCRRRTALILVAASTVTLALAALTAVSFTSMIPVVVGISFLVWVDRLGWRQATLLAAGQILTAAVLGVIGLTVLHQWHDAVGSTVARKRGLGDGLSTVIGAAWRWDMLLFSLAVVAAISAVATRKPRLESLLVVACVLAGAVVPVYQAYIGSQWSLDKHMSAGTAFAALAAGYGISRLRSWFLLSARASAGIVAGALAVPAFTGMGHATATFQTWPNLEPVVSAARQFPGTAPALDHSANGHLNVNILLYYMPNTNWQPTVPRSAFLISQGGYSGIAADLRATAQQATRAQRAAATSDQAFRAYILSILPKHSLITDIEASFRYGIIAVVPYKILGIPGPAGSGMFLVWRVTPPQPHPATHTGKHRTGKRHSGSKHKTAQSGSSGPISSGV